MGSSGKRAYRSSTVDIEQLQNALTGIWKELIEEKEDIHRVSREHGGDPSALEHMSVENAFTIERRGEGISAEATELIIIFSPLAVKILTDLWDHVIFPRILQELGRDSMGAKQGVTPY